MSLILDPRVRILSLLFFSQVPVTAAALDASSTSPYPKQAGSHPLLTKPVFRRPLSDTALLHPQCPDDLGLPASLVSSLGKAARQPPPSHHVSPLSTPLPSSLSARPALSC